MNVEIMFSLAIKFFEDTAPEGSRSSSGKSYCRRKAHQRTEDYNNSETPLLPAFFAVRCQIHCLLDTLPATSSSGSQAWNVQRRAGLVAQSSR